MNIINQLFPKGISESIIIPVAFNIRAPSFIHCIIVSGFV